MPERNRCIPKVGHLIWGLGGTLVKSGPQSLNKLCSRGSELSRTAKAVRPLNADLTSKIMAVVYQGFHLRLNFPL